MAHKHGGDVYTYSGVRDFSANINFQGMPGKVREAAIRAVDLSVHYPDPDCRALRQTLADYENECPQAAEMTGKKHAAKAVSAVMGDDRGGFDRQKLNPEQIICGNGAAELMFALAGAYRPQRALLAIPSFYEYEQALETCGCLITRYALRARQKFVLGKDFLDAAARFAEDAEPLQVSDTDNFPQGAIPGRERADCDNERKMIILGNPNNPTGCVIACEILRALIELCAKKQILLVLDESFLDFLSEEDQAHTFSGACVVPEMPGIFVIRSFTKIYALPGIRFGYGLCSNRQLLAQMRRLLQPWNVSLVAQETARAATREREFARESARLVAVNRGQMAAVLKEAGYEVFPSSVNFLLLRGPENLAEYCLKQGFLIRDCSNFPGLERTGDGKAYFRVCVRSQAENEALLEAMVQGSKREGRTADGESNYDSGHDVKRW
ncbi:MAG: aminotransferase class I/II-fold pyridoxal phosphate-dependent enzyme [Lachnospiraceae bacterium]|nr:aminotransferase class I/II-fold pyridoxal phosphate-dependent enzyme [Lachnospiraceae bacterium]